MPNNTTNNIIQAVREIRKGSGSISLGSIGVITLIVYVAFMVTANSDLFLLIVRFKGIEDFDSPTAYLRFLEDQHLDDINKLIPIVVAAVLLNNHLTQIKSNVINRLLPIPRWVRITALLLVTGFIAIISIYMTYLLDLGTVWYVRKTFLPEAVALQESFGDLHKNIFGYRQIFTASYPAGPTLQPTTLIMIMSLIIILLFANINLLFRRYSIIKGVLIIVAVIFCAVTLEHKIMNSLLPHFVWSGDTPGWSLWHYYPFIIFFSLVLSFYYLLKEKEE